MYFVPIEELVKEISLRQKGSPTRQKYMQYFLEGLRDDAKKLSTSMDNAVWTSIWQGYTPTLSRPFRKSIQESISRELGTSFSHAKCMYDNLNRFLQATYAPEEEIDRRHKKIFTSKKNNPTSIFETYDLRALDQIMQDASLTSNGIFTAVEDLRKERELMETIRNATAHGHGHAMLEFDEKGFFISPEYLKQLPNLKGTKIRTESLSNYLQSSYFSRVAECLRMVTGDSNVMRERKMKDVLYAHIAGRKETLGWNLKSWARGFVPMIASVLLVGLPISNCLKYIPTRKHTDEQTRRQATELCNFQREVKRTDMQLEEVLDKITKLENDSRVLLSYTNRPTSFDSNDVSNRLQKLKKAADAFSIPPQNP